MSLSIASINSGSNGNCYYVGNEEDAVLIDAGISCRETERRMSRMGLNIRRVKALFISHEHTDHIKGVRVLAKKYRLPVYLTEKTYYAINIPLDDVRIFHAGSWVSIGSLRVFPFEKHHDACDPHSFLISNREGVTIGVFTDIGKVCAQLMQHFQCCHAAFLEANYDEQLLQQGSYPFHLKRRISGATGHLSNDDALRLFRDYRPEFMSLLILAHLSRDNNRPELVATLFARYSGNTQIHVASRNEESPVFQVQLNKKQAQSIRQLSFFP